MGHDVDRTLFSRRDRQTYRSKVQRCLDALTLMLREHPFAHDEPMTGVEVELNLVDGDLVPALRSSQVLDALRGLPAGAGPLEPGAQPAAPAVAR